MYLFTIFDTVSKKAGNIFACATIGEAERQFNDALTTAQEGSLFRTHPQDFVLYKLAEFDQDDVKIHSVKKVEIAKGECVLPVADRQPPTPIEAGISQTEGLSA